MVGTLAERDRQQTEFQHGVLAFQESTAATLAERDRQQAEFQRGVLAFQESTAERDRQREQEITYLFDSINHLAGLSQTQIEQAERDRQQAAIDRAEFRSTVRDLLEVLTARFTSNGHSD